jgi:hypothetical protein
MGVLAKLTPKRAPKVLTQVAPTVFKPSKSQATLPTGAELSSDDHDDDPTYFTTAMVLYFGFFGITLLLYPSVHAADGPFPNPVAYFTTIGDDLEFGFHLFGAALVSLCLGPFTDEIFGGVGVKMKAFAEQMCILNTLLFVFFAYYSFCSPLDGAVPLMWKGQAYLCAAILAWNIGELTPVDALAVGYTRFVAAMFSGFGICLLSMPSLFFGPPSPVAYWTEWSELDHLTGRSFGASLLAVCALGYYYMPTADLCKQLTIFNIAFLGLFVLPAYLSDGSAIAFMWEMQLALQLGLVIMGLYLEASGITGSWDISCRPPACGLNLATFNLINLIWFLPFVAGFLTAPNMLFGPSSPTGFPLFTVDLGETGLWFGKAWALMELLIVLGPYVFKLPGGAVAKQMTFQYLFFAGNFVYAILTYSTVNLVMIIALAVVNFLLFALGLFVILPSQSGEALL